MLSIMGRKRHRINNSGKSDRHQHRLYLLHQEERQHLPIFKHRDSIIRCIRDENIGCVVLVGETGSGKSTQVPQFLCEAGMGKICCTQPRRVAAMTLARRVAEEMGTPLGERCGYSVRFDDKTGQETVVKYVTDGVLLREAMSDALLTCYDVLVLDEAHERSLRTDVLFGLVRRLQKTRPKLKLVVMSATFDFKLVMDFFHGAKLLNIPGSAYPVKVFYSASPSVNDPIEAALATCLQIHLERPNGDVLVFLPGRDEIDSLKRLLEEWLVKAAKEEIRKEKDQLGDEMGINGREKLTTDEQQQSGTSVVARAIVRPLYAALPEYAQRAAFAPCTEKGARKFVLATNIAETSVTVPGVRYVVDSGLVKKRRFHSREGVESLRAEAVSQAEARQRCGRAGREAPGLCFRLYSESAFLAMDPHPTPEIQRTNLCEVVLQLKALGVSISGFDFVSPPPKKALLRALETLYALGALGEAGELTDWGMKMSKLPVDPSLAHLLLLACKPMFSCVREALAVVAALSVEHLLLWQSESGGISAESITAAHAQFIDVAGDLPTLANVILAYQANCNTSKNDGYNTNQPSLRNWCSAMRVSQRSMSVALDVHDQLSFILKKRLQMDPKLSCGTEREQLLRCIASGLFLSATECHSQSDNALAGSASGSYRTLKGGREVYIHPSSVLARRRPPPPCVVYTELVITSKEYMRNVTEVNRAWLPELHPRYFKLSNAK
eukprot:332127_1